MKEISNKTVQEIVELLKPYNGKLWGSFDCSLQDDNAQLYIEILLHDSEKNLHDINSPIIEIESPTPEKLKVIEKTIFDIVEPLLPRRKGDYSWIACILIQKLIGAVMGGMQEN